MTLISCDLVMMNNAEELDTRLDNVKGRDDNCEGDTGFTRSLSYRGEGFGIGGKGVFDR